MVFDYWDYEDDGLICVILLSLTFVLMIFAYFVTLYAMKSAKKKYEEYVVWKRTCCHSQDHLE